VAAAEAAALGLMVTVAMVMIQDITGLVEKGVLALAKVLAQAGLLAAILITGFTTLATSVIAVTMGLAQARAGVGQE